MIDTQALLGLSLSERGVRAYDVPVAARRGRKGNEGEGGKW